MSLYTRLHGAWAALWGVERRADAGWRDLFSGGAHSVRAGVRVDQHNAQTHSAVWAATRIISESIAMLPLHLKSRTGKMTDNADGREDYWTLHDMPNPEQDAFTWFAMQVPAQVNSGNAYAEIVRDDNTGQVIELWPIHPSRIPESNIVRNPSSMGQGPTDVGEPGEIVYWVKGDHGEVSPVPRSRMLHVPSVVMSDNGITGKGVVDWGAEVIGTAMQTERHVAAFYRNGATPDLQVKFPNGLPPDEREKLRETWRKVHGGADNAHNVLILTHGGEASALGVNPEQAQLIEARNFSVEEVARLYRVPLHMLMHLQNATYNNIEQEGINFVTHTVLPWAVRWEKCLRMQLLPEGDRRRHFWKFNVTALLRANIEAQAKYFQTLFGLGAMSPNDIRELLDQNPVENGDRYFVQGNNMVPLDQVDRLATLGAQGGDTVSVDDSEEEDDDETQARMDVVRHAARTVLENTLRGLIEYECRQADRLAKDPSTFIDKMRHFYRGKFGDTYHEQVEPCCRSLAACGVVADCNIMSGDHFASSMEAWDAALDVKQDKFEDYVGGQFARWKERPKQIATALLENGNGRNQSAA